MRIEFRKILRPLDIGAYAPDMGGQVLWIWANPPVRLVRDYFEISDDIAKLAKAAKTLHQDELINARESLTERLCVWMAEVLSQGELDSHWTAVELAELERTASDTDPRFWAWMTRSIVDIVLEHRGLLKKKLTMP
jgi:hypothetical protein